jgi:hypothetical protein
VFRNGTINFTAANGDTLVIAQEGSSEVIGDFDGYTLTATRTVLGGTGRFAGATGSGTLDGVGDIPGGEVLFRLPRGDPVQHRGRARLRRVGPRQVDRCQVIAARRSSRMVAVRPSGRTALVPDLVGDPRCTQRRGSVAT